MVFVVWFCVCLCFCMYDVFVCTCFCAVCCFRCVVLFLLVLSCVCIACVGVAVYRCLPFVVHIIVSLFLSFSLSILSFLFPSSFSFSPFLILCSSYCHLLSPSFSLVSYAQSFLTFTVFVIHCCLLFITYCVIRFIVVDHACFSSCCSRCCLWCIVCFVCTVCLLLFLFVIVFVFVWLFVLVLCLFLFVCCCLVITVGFVFVVIVSVS